MKQGQTGGLISARDACLFFYNLYVLGEGLGAILAVPGNPVVGFRRRCQRAKNHAGMRQVLDLFTRQRNTQPFGHKGHEARFEVHVL